MVALVSMLGSDDLLDMLMEHSRRELCEFLTVALMVDGKRSCLMGQTCLTVPWPSNMRAFAPRVTHPSGVVERSGKGLMYR